MKTPAVVVYIDNSFTFGGAINSLKTVIGALDKSKYRPVLVTAQKPAFLSTHFAGIEWHHLDMKLPWIHNRYYKKISAMPFLQRSVFGQKVLKKLRSIFWLAAFTLPEALRIYRIGKKHKAQLVHLNNALGSQLSGIVAAKLMKVPCVAHLRDYEQPCRSARANAARIDHHIAISASIKDNLSALGVSKDRISIVYDAVDPDLPQTEGKGPKFREKKEDGNSPVLIGWFGRIIEWKGLREFVLGLKTFSETFSDFRAVVVGDPSDFGDRYYRSVKDLAEFLDLTDHIVFAGYQEDVMAIMEQMDIIVHSSITPEPFGMVIIEAMACSKPVVASAAGGGPLEIVRHGETGFLVDPKDPGQISNVLATLAGDRKLREKYGSAGRKRVESVFSSRVQVRALEAVYDNLL